jgi:thioesterase domain-containing protein
MFDTNPNLIQVGAAPAAAGSTFGSKAKLAPAILIHDGGGTIFSYYCLGDLGRRVFGIANPRYESGERYEDGIPEMASDYLRFVREAVPEGGDVILGGWSLGGLVALELARQLAGERGAVGGPARLNVIGVVMVDSVCPILGPSPPAGIVKHVIEWAEHTKEETKTRVLRCFENAVYMVDEQWTPPSWEGKGHPPPVVLLKARDTAPVVEAGIAKIDVHRKDPRLGWDAYMKGLITRVIEIPGQHYNLFHTDDNLRTTTEALKQACKEVEDINKSRKLFG